MGETGGQGGSLREVVAAEHCDRDLHRLAFRWAQQGPARPERGQEGLLRLNGADTVD